MILAAGPGHRLLPISAQAIRSPTTAGPAGDTIKVFQETLMIPRLLSTASLALVAFLASGTVGAQQPAPQPAPQAAPQAPMNPKEAKAKFAEKFAAADTNHDGKLSREEAEAGMPEVYKNFDKIDTKKKGEITQKQIGAYFAAKAKQKAAAQNPGSLN